MPNPLALIPEQAQTQPKRNRIQLSCSHCRHAKLKCDRQKPCSQCVKKGRAPSCIFQPAVKGKPKASMHNRLKHLESLVKGAMNGQPSEKNVFQQGNSLNANNLNQSSNKGPETVVEHDQLPQTSPNAAISSASGQIFVGTNESTYVGATHWAAILDDIEEVKSYFDQVDADDENIRPDTSLIFNSPSSATKEDLIAALPERNVVDQLIYRYFNSNSPAIYVIHKPTFQKDYSNFWADPHGASISWVGLLYSLMCLATFAAHGAGEEIPDTRGTSMEMIRTYRGCCAQCLVLSKYTQPGPYTIETILIYMEAEFILGKDDQMNCFLLASVAVRLALRMGLHRDPSNVTAEVSICQGELRRRVWGLLRQIDLLVSFHVGLPAMIQFVDSDTQPPRNLRDEDFDERTTVLPPSRPKSEMTPMSYAVAKGPLFKAFGKVAEQANRLSLPSYDEIMEVDKELNHAYDRVPTFLRMVPIQLSITDSPKLIIQRISIALLVHKIRCVLHRKYLTAGDLNHEYGYSRKVALDASMKLLQLQSDIHDSIQPGGILSKDLWIISSLSMHDFLLAAMIAYVLFAQTFKLKLQTSVLPSPNKERSKIFEALKRSLQVWSETRHLSVYANKAYEVLQSIVQRAERISGSDATKSAAAIVPNNKQPIPAAPSEPALTPGLVGMNDFPGSASVWGYSDHLLGTNTGGIIDDSTLSSMSASQFNSDLMQIPTDSLGAMIDMPMTLDWSAFDNEIRQQPQAQQQSTWPDLDLGGFNIEDHFDYDL